MGQEQSQDASAHKLLEVDVSAKRITELPPSICAQKSLRIVQASFNFISRLPERFSDLQLLSELDLSYNRFTSVPGQICNMLQLRTLVFVGNKLSAIPDDFAKLEQLQVLRLGVNNFTEIPVVLFKMKMLSSLHINNNLITRFPDLAGFDELAPIVTLNVEYNKLESIPASITKLTTLRSLRMSYNKLEELPQSFQQLQELRTLSLSYNNLKVLPKDLCKLEELRYLDVSMNQIEELPFTWFDSLIKEHQQKKNKEFIQETLEAHKEIREKVEKARAGKARRHHHKTSAEQASVHLRNHDVESDHPELFLESPTRRRSAETFSMVYYLFIYLLFISIIKSNQLTIN